MCCRSAAGNRSGRDPSGWRKKAFRDERNKTITRPGTVNISKKKGKKGRRKKNEQKIEKKTTPLGSEK